MIRAKSSAFGRGFTSKAKNHHNRALSSTLLRLKQSHIDTYYFNRLLSALHYLHATIQSDDSWPNTFFFSNICAYKFTFFSKENLLLWGCSHNSSESMFPHLTLKTSAKTSIINLLLINGSLSFVVAHPLLKKFFSLLISLKKGRISSLKFVCI